MSYSLSAKLEGADDLVKALKKAPDIARKELSDAVELTANEVKKKEQDNAPVKTARLKGSIDYKGPEIKLNNIQATVGTNVKYAQVQEFGSKSYGITVRNKKVLANKKTRQIFGRKVNHPGVKGRFFMKKALEESKGYMEKAVSDAVQKVLKFITN